jgi:hypothetical protein
MTPTNADDPLRTTDFSLALEAKMPREDLTTDAPPAQDFGATPSSPVVPGYVILGELGRGARGVVYKARQAKLNRLVALKMVLSGAHAGAEELTRFRAEAEAIAQLHHPNIVQVYEVGECDGLPFFSLEYCPGGSLGRKLAGAPAPPREEPTTTAGRYRSYSACAMRRASSKSSSGSFGLMTSWPCRARNVGFTPPGMDCQPRLLFGGPILRPTDELEGQLPGRRRCRRCRRGQRADAQLAGQRLNRPAPGLSASGRAKALGVARAFQLPQRYDALLERIDAVMEAAALDFSALIVLAETLVGLAGQAALGDPIRFVGHRFYPLFC